MLIWPYKLKKLMLGRTTSRFESSTSCSTQRRRSGAIRVLRVRVPPLLKLHHANPPTVAIATYFINYVTETRPGTSNSTAANFLAVAQGCFAIGRFSGSVLMRFVRPRIVFLAYLTGVVAFNAAAIDTVGNTGLAMLNLTLFFESVCFPTIVALSIRGLGRHTKRGAGLIIAGVSGGAAVPAMLGAVADNKNDTGFAMVVPTCFMIASWSYAICVNYVPAYRDVADKIGESSIGLDGEGGAVKAKALGGGGGDEESGLGKMEEERVEVVGVDSAGSK